MTNFKAFESRHKIVYMSDKETQLIRGVTLEVNMIKLSDFKLKYSKTKFPGSSHGNM